MGSGQEPGLKAWRRSGYNLRLLIATPAGSILWKGTPGGPCAVLAVHVRAVLGESRRRPFGRCAMDGWARLANGSGTVSSRILTLPSAGRTMPPLTRPTDVAPIRHALAARTPGARLVEMDYSPLQPRR